jgi:hypothetical protein
MNTALKPADQQFPLPYDAYAAFDAVTLKQLMLQRLNENSLFTDQIYEGSNFNNLIDVIAYSYNVLLYYLNKTSNESLFASSQIYENMSKIVKILNYNPVGYQSSILKFEATSNANLPPNIYTIPRYSYFTIDDIYYSFTQDVTFIKTLSGSELLQNLSDEVSLIQGNFVEYPLYVATGEPYEQITVTSINDENENEKIDHNGIDVYVRNESGNWEQWQRVESLYLSNGNDKVFECRFNENQRYVIKFGNNVTGKQLNAGNVVSIYYLRTDLKMGQVGPGTLNGNRLFIYNSQQYNTIMPFVRELNSNVITTQESSSILFENNTSSSLYSELESSAQIKQNAPNIFKSQGRLVSTKDFEAYIVNNFNHLVHDVRVVNNWEYIDGHVKYLHNIGLKSPSLDSRVAYNQLKYADSCNFNDVYIYCVPKIVTTNSISKNSNYLNSAAKQAILNKVNVSKLATVEPVFQDPVYIGIGFGLKRDVVGGKDDLNSILSETRLVVQKTNSTFTSDNSIKEKIVTIINDYFDFSKTKLGMFINVDAIIQHILEINGVDSVYTERMGDGYNISLPGLSLAVFNPVYSNIDEDVMTTSQSVQLPFFKIPFVYDSEQLKNNIVVVSPNYISSGTREF